MRVMACLTHGFQDLFQRCAFAFIAHHLPVSHKHGWWKREDSSHQHHSCRLDVQAKGWKLGLLLAPLPEKTAEVGVVGALVQAETGVAVQTHQPPSVCICIRSACRSRVLVNSLLALKQTPEPAQGAALDSHSGFKPHTVVVGSKVRQNLQTCLRKTRKR
jgi:hypothetical protein